MPFLISLNDFILFFPGAGRKIEMLVDQVGSYWQLCSAQDNHVVETFGKMRLTAYSIDDAICV